MGLKLLNVRYTNKGMGTTYISQQANVDVSTALGADYIRTIHNNTGLPVIIADASGRTVTHDSNYIPPHITEREIIVEEWFSAMDYADMVDVYIARDSLAEGMYKGVMLQTRIPLEDLRANPNGIYKECVNLQIGLADSVVHDKHPRFSKKSRLELADMDCVTVSVELLDPRCLYDAKFVKIGDRVHTLIPKRYPSPAKEGIVIQYTDITTMEVKQEIYDISELTTGVGKQGLRVYNFANEAESDLRDPVVAAMCNERSEWGKERVALIKGVSVKVKEATERTAIDTRTMLELEMMDREREVEAKLRQSERVADKAHELSKRDKTNLFSNVAKVVLVSITFITGIIAFFN